MGKVIEGGRAGGLRRLAAQAAEFVSQFTNALFGALPGFGLLPGLPFGALPGLGLLARLPLRALPGSTFLAVIAKALLRLRPEKRGHSTFHKC
jgi:hypothetical protein